LISQISKKYLIVDNYVKHWPIHSMLIAHLEYISEITQRMKGRNVAARVEKAFGKVVEVLQQGKGSEGSDGG
jgi:hypothetical protein